MLLRQYEEEMLDAFLQEDDYFPAFLRPFGSKSDKPSESRPFVIPSVAEGSLHALRLVEMTKEISPRWSR